MRRIHRLPIGLAMLLAAAGGLPAQAQYQSRGPSGPPGAYPPPPVQGQRAYPPGYYPGKLVRPAPQPQGFSLRRLFGVPDEEPPPPPVLRPVIPREARPARPRPVAPVAAARQERPPKVNAATQVVVFGDAFAELTSQGIDDVYADNPDLAVVRRTRPDGGLARPDGMDWPKTIRETLEGGQAISLAVVMLGANDRQPIRQDTETLEPLSEKWQEAYRRRVDAVMQAFRDRNVPVVWIGVPPMKSDKLSEDLIAMNEIIRESVQRLGGAYVDIWPGFVDDDNHYTVTGPDVEGQPAKLRATDGILFTKAGARKVAHFADVEIKRILEARQDSAVASLPATPESAPSVPVGSGLPSPPEPPGAPLLPVKPLIGPVLPLNRTETSPGGTLVASPPRLDADKAYAARRALRDGASGIPQPGRADDFRWQP
ncbi:MAG: SGNH family hydrolase [Microvirga sp.]